MHNYTVASINIHSDGTYSVDTLHMPVDRGDTPRIETLYFIEVGDLTTFLTSHFRQTRNFYLKLIRDLEGENKDAYN